MSYLCACVVEVKKLINTKYSHVLVGLCNNHNCSKTFLMIMISIWTIFLIVVDCNVNGG
jgi:hypothetical protein